MPIIPLLSQTNPLPNAPDAVLDRERRPRVNTSNVQQAIGNLANASQLPLANGRALAAPYEGLAAIGESIARTGSVLAAVEEKSREAETRWRVGEADQGFDNLLTSYKAEIETTPNRSPSEWAPELQKRIAAYRTQITERKDLSPDAIAEIDRRLSLRTSAVLIGTESAARKELNMRAKKTVWGEVEIAKQTQDAARKDAALSELKSKGWAQGFEIEAAELDFQKEGERQRKQAEADSYDKAQDQVITYTTGMGEAEALKELDAGLFGDFAAADKERLRSSIKQVSNARGAEMVSSLADGISAGNITSPARIDELAFDNPHLTPKLVDEAKRYLLSRNAMAEKLDRDENGIRNAVEYRRKVMDYQPSEDPDRTKYFTLVQEIGSRVEQSMAGELTGELYKKYGTQPPKVPVRPEIQQNVSKTLDRLFDPKTGAIPWRIETKVKEAGKTKVEWLDDAAKKQKAINAQTIVEMKMADWFKMNPEKATSLPAVQAALNSFLPEGTQAGAVSAIKRLYPARPAAKPAIEGDLPVFDVDGDPAVTRAMSLFPEVER